METCFFCNSVHCSIKYTSALCFVPLLCSHASAESHGQTALCQRNTLCKDGLPAKPALQQWHRVRDLRVGRDRNT